MARTLGLVVAVLLVCGAAYAQPMDGTIVQWDWFDTSTPSGQQWWSYVADYVHHELGAQFEISGGGVDDRFPVAVAGGVPIDAIQVPYHLAQFWPKVGCFIPLRSILNATTCQFMSSFPVPSTR